MTGGDAGPGAAYDPVATLYDRAFADIRVRRAEWGWLTQRLLTAPARPRVLEIGCGTGALLRALAPRIDRGIGLDLSGEMLRLARERALPNLSFQLVTGPRFPLERGSVDLVISFLSFRYLDWRAIWPEIRRVLTPGGRFLLIDLVKERAQLRDAPALARSALRNLVLPLTHPRFARTLRELTSQAAWREMLQRHPMRPFDEYRTFFAGELPERGFDVLDVAPGRRVVALDSGPLP